MHQTTSRSRACLSTAIAVIATAGIGCGSDKAAHPADARADSAVQTPDAAMPPVDPVKGAAEAMIDEGRQTFRYDTFGDEDFWAARCDCTRRSRALRTAASGRA